MQIQVVHATAHQPEEYDGFRQGFRAVRLIGDAGDIRRELAWRLASRWNAVVEIKEFGLHNEADRRKGWGTKLLQAGIDDMEAYLSAHGEG